MPVSVTPRYDDSALRSHIGLRAIAQSLGIPPQTPPCNERESPTAPHSLSSGFATGLYESEAHRIRKTSDATMMRIDGGYSSAAERLTVAQDVVGSIPTSRPNLESITYLDLSPSSVQYRRVLELPREIALACGSSIAPTARTVMAAALLAGIGSPRQDHQ